MNRDQMLASIINGLLASGYYTAHADDSDNDKDHPYLLGSEMGPEHQPDVVRDALFILEHVDIALFPSAKRVLTLPVA